VLKVKDLVALENGPISSFLENVERSMDLLTELKARNGRTSPLLVMVVLSVVPVVVLVVVLAVVLAVVLLVDVRADLVFGCVMQRESKEP